MYLSMILLWLVYRSYLAQQVEHVTLDTSLLINLPVCRLQLRLCVFNVSLGQSVHGVLLLSPSSTVRLGVVRASHDNHLVMVDKVFQTHGRWR